MSKEPTGAARTDQKCFHECNKQFFYLQNTLNVNEIEKTERITGRENKVHRNHCYFLNTSNAINSSKLHSFSQNVSSFMLAGKLSLLSVFSFSDFQQ